MASPDKNNHSDIMLDFSDLNLSIDSTKGMSHPTPSFTQDENINYSNLFDQSVNDSQATVLDTSLNTTLTGFVSDADQSDSSFSLSSGLSLFRDIHWPVSPIAQRPVSSPEIVSPLDDDDPVAAERPISLPPNAVVVLALVWGPPGASIVVVLRVPGVLVFAALLLIFCFSTIRTFFCR